MARTEREREQERGREAITEGGGEDDVWGRRGTVAGSYAGGYAAYVAGSTPRAQSPVHCASVNVPNVQFKL